MVKENLLEKNLYSVAQLLEVNGHPLYVKYLLFYLLDGKKTFSKSSRISKETSSKKPSRSPPSDATQQSDGVKLPQRVTFLNTYKVHSIKLAKKVTV
jgi:hypothetical protein